jgi:hypothetical protein
MTFDPSDAVILGVVGFVQVVVLAMLGIILKRAETTKKDVRDTKEQIVNDHPKTPNYRDENDSRHAETRNWFWALWNQQARINKKLEEQDDMLVYLATGYDSNRGRIEDLENGREHNHE